MLAKLIEQEGRGAQAQIVAAATIAGAANAGAIAVINTAAKHPEQSNWLLLGLLIAAAAIFAIGLRVCVGRMSSLIEAILRKMRIRLADKIRQAELLGLEAIGTSEIFERLTQQTHEISSATFPIALAVQAGSMILCGFLYLGYLSPVVLIVTLGVYGGTGIIFAMHQRASEKLIHENAGLRVQLLDTLSDLVHGFKEVRFRTQRGEEIHADFRAHSESLEQGSVNFNLFQQENYVFANLSQFALLGAAVFIIPQLTGMNTQSVAQVTAALIFLFGPMSGLLDVLPAYGKADLACQNIVDLEQRLDALTPLPQHPNPQAFDGPFRELELVALAFERRDATGQSVFAVGPVSLSIRAGEIVFLVGGNGSGKTTLLRTLTALYPPTGGLLCVNGVPVSPHNVQTYREMIAAIFTDFHLFKKLYGLSASQAEPVERLLEQLQIADKTHLVDGVWSTVELSSGQRKRVAMVVALLEDRPIYIFDEWAADQDPEFRRYFYEGLLPDLKRQGKTVIAISHDDRYFHCADRVVTLEYGKLRSIEEPRSPMLPPSPPASGIVPSPTHSD